MMSQTRTYQKLLLFLLHQAYDEGYRRYRDQCCVEIRNTRAWKPVKEIKDFVYDATQKEDNPEIVEEPDEPRWSRGRRRAPPVKL